MKVIVQRVKKASCIVDNKIISSIDYGMMLLVGFTINDNLDHLKLMAKKIANLRIFEDDNHKINLNLSDINGSVLSISQFTLYADVKKGNRPSFVNCMNSAAAEPLYDKFNQILKNDYGLKVETGVFGADMVLDLVCDGPVTIELEY